MDKSKDFKTVREGSTYELPLYEVIAGQGLVKTNESIIIPYVRGAKDSEGIVKQTGVIAETVIGMQLNHLEYAYSQVPSEQTAKVIEHLKESLVLLSQRTKQRTEAGVVDTYKQIHQEDCCKDGGGFNFGSDELSEKAKQIAVTKEQLKK
jgi:hypothetical protein